MTSTFNSNQNFTKITGAIIKSRLNFSLIAKVGWKKQCPELSKQNVSWQNLPGLKILTDVH